MTNRITRTRTKIRIRSSRKYRKRDVRKNSNKRRNKTAKLNVFDQRKRMTVKMKGGAGSWSCKCRNPLPAHGDISKVGDISKEDNDAKLKKLQEDFNQGVIQQTPALPPQQVSTTRAAVAAGVAAAMGIRRKNLQQYLSALQYQQQQLREEGAQLLPQLSEEIKRLQGNQLVDIIDVPIQESVHGANSVIRNIRPDLVTRSRPPPPPRYPRYPRRLPPIVTTQQSSSENKGYYDSGIKRDMIKQTDGKYFIYGKHKGSILPHGLKPGEQISKINGQDPNPTNIASLFTKMNKNETTTLTLTNNEGGTIPNSRTITINYPIEYRQV